MQIVSELQRRPEKGRLATEIAVVSFFDLCTVAQLVTLVVHCTWTTIAYNRTFESSLMTTHQFGVVPQLEYRTRGCAYSTTMSIYAYTDLHLNISTSDVAPILCDQATAMRSAIFVSAFALLLGLLNRTAVEMNFFVYKIKSLELRKDIISAIELVLLGYVIMLASSAAAPAKLLKDFLNHCGVAQEVYLPNVPVVSLYVFAAVGYFTYFISLILYLIHALPKYGVMSPEEIEEYKLWLSARRLELEQSRQMLDEAKRNYARMHLYRMAHEMYGGPSAEPATQEALAGGLLSVIPPPYVGEDGTLYPGYEVGRRSTLHTSPAVSYPNLAMASTPQGSTIGMESVNMPRRRLVPSDAMRASR